MTWLAPDLPNQDDSAGLSVYADVVVDAIGNRTDLELSGPVAGRVHRTTTSHHQIKYQEGKAVDQGSEH